MKQIVNRKQLLKATIALSVVFLSACSLNDKSSEEYYAEAYQPYETETTQAVVIDVADVNEAQAPTTLTEKQVQVEKQKQITNKEEMILECRTVSNYETHRTVSSSMPAKPRVVPVKPIKSVASPAKKPAVTDTQLAKKATSVIDNAPIPPTKPAMIDEASTTNTVEKQTKTVVTEKTTTVVPPAKPEIVRQAPQAAPMIPSGEIVEEELTQVQKNYPAGELVEQDMQADEIPVFDDVVNNAVDEDALRADEARRQAEEAARLAAQAEGAGVEEDAVAAKAEAEAQRLAKLAEEKRIAEEAAAAKELAEQEALKKQKEEQEAQMKAEKEKVEAELARLKAEKDSLEMEKQRILESKAKAKSCDDVKDWVAAEGTTLRTLITEWGNQSGWRVVWNMDRDYVLEAGAVFRGRFVDVSAALLRSFARATPAPKGTFYKGNKVLVVNTREDENAE